MILWKIKTEILIQTLLKQIYTSLSLCGSYYLIPNGDTSPVHRFSSILTLLIALKMIGI